MPDIPVRKLREFFAGPEYRSELRRILRPYKSYVQRNPQYELLGEDEKDDFSVVFVAELSDDEFAICKALLEKANCYVFGNSLGTHIYVAGARS